jgi:gas vesicle protein
MNWKNVLEQAQNSMTNTFDGVQSSLLDRLDLTQKRSTTEVVLPVLGIIGLSIAAGAALGMMFAPKRGVELRQDLKHRISDARDIGAEQVGKFRSTGENLIQSARALSGAFATSKESEKEQNTNRPTNAYEEPFTVKMGDLFADKEIIQHIGSN